jgi:hypothetical protein
MLIDVAISRSRNVIERDAEKILKYKALTMWNVKTKVMPVIIGATGTIPQSLRKYLSNMPGNHAIKEVQKTAVLGTTYILRKVLLYACKYKTFNVGSNITSAINCSCRTVATVYALSTVSFQVCNCKHPAQR